MHEQYRDQLSGGMTTMGYDGLVLRNSSTSNSHQQQQQREKNASTSNTSTATAAAARLSPFASASSSSEAEESDQLLSVLQMSMDDDSAGTFDLREPRLPAFRAISPPLLQHQHERFSSITPPPARSNSTPPGGLHDDFDMTATAGMVSDPALLQQFASLGLGDRQDDMSMMLQQQQHVRYLRQQALQRMQYSSNPYQVPSYHHRVYADSPHQINSPLQSSSTFTARQSSKLDPSTDGTLDGTVDYDLAYGHWGYPRQHQSAAGLAMGPNIAPTTMYDPTALYADPVSSLTDKKLRVLQLQQQLLLQQHQQQQHQFAAQQQQLLLQQQRGRPIPRSSRGFVPNIQHPDITMSVRSPLLEEFRNSKSKRYHLKDIAGHMVEFSGDQHGSRFIQQKLETANSEEKQMVFEEILPNALQLMTDVFGNYVLQKFFEHGNQSQKTILAKQMEGHVVSLSLQMYGCRVVQKALEHVLTEQQARLVKELDGCVLKCIKDQNGNHVIQKAIERVPAKHIQFIIDAFHGKVYNLATHPYGCRVIQRMFEHCSEEQMGPLMDELDRCTPQLIQDQYGNYVIQHILERGKPSDKAAIINKVKGQVLQLSKHKFASNVVEKCFDYGSKEDRQMLIDEVLQNRPDGSCPLIMMMKDQYANYVVQKMLDVVDDDQRGLLVSKIKPHMQALKRLTYGRHLLLKMEKLLPNETKTETSETCKDQPATGRKEAA